MKYLKFLFSGAFMGILLLVFAYAIGYATFVENDYGAIAAKVLVYNARWFEILLFFMVVNFAGMIFTKHLYLRNKLNILAIHLALIIIILGAGITRYFGYEGMMHIRNGQTTNVIRSSDNYLQIQVGEGENEVYHNEKIYLTTVRNVLADVSLNDTGVPINVIAEDYYDKATQVIENTNGGKPYITVQYRSNSASGEINMTAGDIENLGNVALQFGGMVRGNNVHLKLDRGELLVKNAFTQEQIATMDSSRTRGDGYVVAQLMDVFTIGDAAFRVTAKYASGNLKFQPVEDPDAAGFPILKISVNDQEQYIRTNSTVRYDIGGTPVLIRVGGRSISVPFEMRLEKFDLERYPGSNSPSSYASDVTVIDKANNKEFPFRIYMNNVLDYGGYRFFQSSYDQDEQGTVLSVNHDYWGTLVTYVGYFLLFSTLIISFFTKTRFMRINMMLKDVHNHRKKLLAKTLSITILMFISAVSYAQPPVAEKEHAAKFGELFVQSNAGRIEPVNTMSSKMLVKISKKDSYKGLTADQVVLGMITNSEAWRNQPIIKVPEEEIRDLLGISGDLASFSDFITADEQYKIGQYVEAANQKKPAARSTFDKGIIYVDERVNVCYSLLSGIVLRVFPLQNDANNTWVNPTQFHQHLGHGNGSADLFENYSAAIITATETGDYTDADAFLKMIEVYQATAGSAVLPSGTKARVEILYNKANIFKKLFPVFMMLGILLVGIFLIQIFYPNLEFKLLGDILFIIMAIAFALQTIGLAARWYISNHAPWSNGYESMIYIAWATVLAGFAFRNKSTAVLGITALLAGITLLTAHMSWLNPEVTNLVPVLKSYWLTFHVATITASYGFLGLGCMIGFLNLCIMIFRNKKNKEMVNLTLRELMLITEMSLAVGLVLLVIGNFLGGIWANESWGRYWGWDPKETWTLVTVIMYSFTLHLTLIPAIRNTFTFSFFSFISFGTVLMTYFGVNYYLSGLHSYANGDPVAVPVGLYYALIVIGIISLLAAYNEFKFTDEEPSDG